MPTSQFKINRTSKMLFARDENADPAVVQAELIRKAVETAVAEATTGLTTKNQELLGKLAKKTEDLKKFEGFDPEKLTAIQARLDNDEDVKLFSEGKKNEVIHKYTERMRAEHDAQLQAEREKTAKEAQRADAYKGSVLDNQIRAVTGELHKGAVEDALLLARNIFSLDEKGNAVKRNADGGVELGKDGQTPFSPSEWMDMQKELKPHWFPSGTGGSGAGGGREAGAGNGKTIKRVDFDRLTPSEQRQVSQTSKIVD